MEEASLFGLLKLTRGMTLASVNAVSEEMADRQPDGFNNTIRWNVGHIYVTLNNLVYGFSGETTPSPEGFNRLFDRGTKPSDWGDETVPGISELKRLLAAQPDEIEQAFKGRLDEPVKMPFNLYDTGQSKTLADTLNFAIYHEGLHLGFINGIKRALGVEALYSE